MTLVIDFKHQIISIDIIHGFAKGAKIFSNALIQWRVNNDTDKK